MMVWFSVFSILVLIGVWITIDKILYPFESDLEQVRQSFANICAEATDPSRDLNECIDFETKAWLLTQDVMFIFQILGAVGLLGLIFLFLKRKHSTDLG
jgi:hypothetical protein